MHCSKPFNLIQHAVLLIAFDGRSKLLYINQTKLRVDTKGGRKSGAVHTANLWLQGQQTCFSNGNLYI